MIDEIEDVTDRTKGGMVFRGTASFFAEGGLYGSSCYLFRADDETSAIKTLDSLSETSFYADPRIDFIRDFDVEVDDESCEILGEPNEA